MTEINLLLLDDFIAEAAEHLDEMESCLLQLAGDTGNVDVLNDIFRTIHNIKGGSQLTGLDRVSRLAHRLEDLLDLLRQGQKTADTSIVETLIAGRDRIVQLVGELEASQQEVSPVEDLVEQVTGLIETTDTETRQDVAAPGAAEAMHTPTAYEEEYDSELYAIFIGHVEEKIELLAAQTVQLPDAPQPMEGLDDCAEAVAHLRCSANYMGYEELTDLYAAWSIAIEGARQALARDESPSFAFMDDNLDRLVGLFPQLGETRAAAVLAAPVGNSEVGSNEADSTEADGDEAETEDDADITAEVLAAFGEQAVFEEDDVFAEQEIVAEAAVSEINLLLLGDFIAEAGEHLDEMESSLLQLADNAGNIDILNDIFRTIHNIKGGSQLTGLDRISRLAHRLEDLLDLLREGQKTADVTIVETLIAGRDRIVQLVGELEASQQEFSPVDDLVARLTGLIENADAGSQQPQDTTAPDTGAANYEEEHDSELYAIFIGHVEEKIGLLSAQTTQLPDAPEPVERLDCCSEAVERLRSSANYMGYEELTDLYETWGVAIEEARYALAREGNVSFVFMDDYLDRLVGLFPQLEEVRITADGTQPAASEIVQVAQTENIESTSDGALYEHLNRSLDASRQTVSDSEYEALQGVFGEMVSSRKEELAADTAVVKTSSDSQPMEQKAKQKTEQKPATTKRQEKTVRKSMRVDAEKIDALMNQVGELVVDRSYFFQLFSEMRDLQKHLKEVAGIDQKDVKLVRAFSYKLGEAIASLGRTSNELQEGVMKMRMLPVSHLFNRYPRLVHDLTHNSDKKVNLVIRGEETELDKMIVEELSDPLIHIIRNAIDHGLESAKEREQLGKTDTGALMLQAYQESNQIVIEVTDNGRGLDLQRIKATALNKQLYPEDELERMTDRELMRLILAPGFSTAEKITGTSGRGVGMDVVKRNIEKLNGTLDIDSKPGVGTRMRLKIPLTLAIIHALMVRVGVDMFAIPLPNVDETIRINKSDTSIVEGVEVIHLRGVALPIFRLSSLFNLDVDSHNGKSFVVVVRTEGKRIGFVVDELKGQTEVVIKPLAEYVQGKSGFSGATVVGDGRIALILDIHELVKMSANQQINRHRERTAELKASISHRSGNAQAPAGR